MKTLLINVLILLSFSGLTQASDLSLLSDEALDHRYQFIKSRFAEQHDDAFWWQHGWEGLYAVSATAQAAGWAAADTHDDKVRFRAGVIKSSAAFAAMYAKPLPGSRVYITTPCDGCKKESRVYKINRLEQAEQALKSRALRAVNIHSVKRHSIAIIFNVLAGMYVAKHGDEDDAIASTLGGIISSEVNIFTQPTRAKQDWQDYQTLGQTKTSDTWNWKLDSTDHGLALNFQF